jgi:hypothetical protein
MVIIRIVSPSVNEGPLYTLLKACPFVVEYALFQILLKELLPIKLLLLALSEENSSQQRSFMLY